MRLARPPDLATRLPIDEIWIGMTVSMPHIFPTSTAARSARCARVFIVSVHFWVTMEYLPFFAQESGFALSGTPPFFQGNSVAGCEWCAGLASGGDVNERRRLNGVGCRDAQGASW